jgi:hypothetical protein
MATMQSLEMKLAVRVAANFLREPVFAFLAESCSTQRCAMTSLTNVGQTAQTAGSPMKTGAEAPVAGTKNETTIIVS